MKSIILSAVIIAKNAEEMISDCIDSLSFCDEVIVVDGGSTDITVAIAKKKGAAVVNGDRDDFAKQRNIGKEKAKGEWVLYVDTDERVSKELAENIQKAIHLNEFSAYRLQRKNYYLGKNPWPKIELLERLFKKSALIKWYGALHETAEITGEVGTLNGYLLHYTHRNLSSMLDKTIQWSKVEAELRYKTHHPKIVAWRLVRVMMTGFWDSYIMQGGWKAGTMGLIESMYQAYSMFVTYSTLWEMQENHEKLS